MYYSGNVNFNASKFPLNEQIIANTQKYFEQTGIVPIEEFRFIDLEGIQRNRFVISSFGRVFDIVKNKERSQSFSTTTGYMYISLNTEIPNNYKSIGVHRLVACMFIPVTEDDIDNNRIEVNHKDLNRLNNCVWNLEFMSKSENIKHSKNARTIEAGCFCPISYFEDGETFDPNYLHKDLTVRDGQYRLADEQVHIICKCLEEGRSYSYCCIAAGILDEPHNRNIICNIAAGRRWTDISYYYNIPKPKELKDLTEFVVPVCELLQQGKGPSAIARELHINDDNFDSARMFVSQIKNRKSYTDISKNYKW